MRGSLQCTGDLDPLAEAQLRTANATALLVPWDVRPWNLGFAADESPDLAGLLTAALDGTASLEDCKLGLSLWTTEATGTLGTNGARVFHSPNASVPAFLPELHVQYEPPTTAEQSHANSNQFRHCELLA